jgi:putative spermidine/putrescine transport system ATP-binding protein
MLQCNFAGDGRNFCAENSWREPLAGTVAPASFDPIGNPAPGLDNPAMQVIVKPNPCRSSADQYCAENAIISPFVAFDRVQKSYDGETLVVKDLNLSMPKGEFLTMLGPSGSGKTTCLMMLAGFETATHGRILLDGVSINDIPPHKRGIGMVFQNYALFPHMTVAENLSASRWKCERSESRTVRRKSSAHWTWFRWARFGGRRPAQLSGGQQQRVALARALVFEPELVS